MNDYIVNGNITAQAGRIDYRTRPENRIWVCVPTAFEVRILGQVRRYQTSSVRDAIRSACESVGVIPSDIVRS